MLLTLSILTIVLSGILVFFNWKIHRNSLYLGLFFLVFASYGLTHYFTVYGKSPFWLAIFYNHLAPLWLLPGPLLYFYVKATLTDKRAWSNWKDGLHFLPAVMGFIGIIPYYLKSFSEKKLIAANIIANLDQVKNLRLNLFYQPVVGFIARPSLLLAYSLYVLWMIWRFSANKELLKHIPEKQFELSKRWISLLGIISVGAATGFLILTIQAHQTPITQVVLHSMPLHYAVGIAFCLLSSSLLFFPEVLYGMPVLGAKYPAVKKAKKETNLSSNPSTANPFLPLAEKIITYMHTDKPFVHPDFSMSHIALNLNIPQHHVAYCFNSVLKKKFTSIRAELRIAHAKELLDKGLSDTLSIDGIGFKSGFSTRSNFYATFKEITGCTPSEYLEEKNTL